MNPILTLLLGAATGATLVKLAQKSNSKAYVKRAQKKLYESTASSLESLEQTSAKLRHKLEATDNAEEVKSQTEELGDDTKNQ